MPQLRTHDEYNNLLSSNSELIKVCRVLCIFFMMYVHVHLFAHEYFSQTHYFLIIKELFANLFGRSSVPLLSVISGFLMVSYVKRYTYKSAVKNKFLTLAIPFFVWNIIGMLYAFIAGDEKIYNFYNDIFALSDRSHYVHLTFLRDLLVISILSPIIICGIRKYGVISLFLIILLAYVFGTSPIILKEQILIYYSIGIFFALYKIEGFLFNKFTIYVVTLITVGLIFFTAAHALNQNTYVFLESAYYDNIFRRPLLTYFFLMIGMFFLNFEILKRYFIEKIEPIIYLVFLNHVFISGIVGAIYFRLNMLHMSPVYFLVWLFIPVVAIISSIFMSKILLKMPGVFSLALTGRAL